MTRDTKNIIYASIVILLIATAVRFIYVDTVLIDAPIRADTKKYLRIAVNIVEHGVYSHHEGNPPVTNVMITPGYPMMLTAVWVFTKDLKKLNKTVMYLQALLGGITVLILFLVAIRFLPFWSACLFATLIIFSPHQIIFSGYLLTETIFTFLLSIAVLSLVIALMKMKPKHYLIAGLFFGIAALVRPVILLYPIIVCFIFILYKRDKTIITFSAYLLIGTIVTWTPWVTWKTIYNESRNEISLAAASFAYGSYPNLVYRGAKKNYENDRYLRAYSYKEDIEYDQMARNIKTALAVTLKRATKNPTEYIKWYFIGKPAMFWAWDNNMSIQGGPFVYPVLRSIYHQTLWGALSYHVSRILYPIIIIFSLVSVIILIVEYIKNRVLNIQYLIPAVILAIPVYFTLVHMFLLPLPRYAVPVHVFAYLLGFFSISYIVNYIKTLLEKNKILTKNS